MECCNSKATMCCEIFFIITLFLFSPFFSFVVSVSALTNALPILYFCYVVPEVTVVPCFCSCGVCTCVRFLTLAMFLTKDALMFHRFMFRGDKKDTLTGMGYVVCSWRNTFYRTETRENSHNVWIWGSLAFFFFCVCVGYGHVQSPLPLPFLKQNKRLWI
jgi:hypothetical protein